MKVGDRVYVKEIHGGLISGVEFPKNGVTGVINSTECTYSNTIRYLVQIDECTDYNNYQNGKYWVKVQNLYKIDQFQKGDWVVFEIERAKGTMFSTEVWNKDVVLRVEDVTNINGSYTNLKFGRKSNWDVMFRRATDKEIMQNESLEECLDRIHRVAGQLKKGPLSRFLSCHISAKHWNFIPGSNSEAKAENLINRWKSEAKALNNLELGSNTGGILSNISSNSVSNGSWIPLPGLPQNIQDITFNFPDHNYLLINPNLNTNNQNYECRESKNSEERTILVQGPSDTIGSGSGSGAIRIRSSRSKVEIREVNKPSETRTISIKKRIILSKER